jgi:hypothetical protein
MHVIDNDIRSGIGIQAVPFATGGLIQAAVGLAGGTGFFFTNRSWLAANAWSSMACRAACTASA